jgi:hypothetical protein
MTESMPQVRRDEAPSEADPRRFVDVRSWPLSRRILFIERIEPDLSRFADSSREFTYS